MQHVPEYRERPPQPIRADTGYRSLYSHIRLLTRQIGVKPGNLAGPAGLAGSRHHAAPTGRRDLRAPVREDAFRSTIWPLDQRLAA
jgi:hypothetical protein